MKWLKRKAKTAAEIDALNKAAASDDSEITHIRYRYTEADVMKALTYEDYEPTFEVMRIATKRWTSMKPDMFVKAYPANKQQHWEAMRMCSRALTQDMQRASDPSIKAAKYGGVQLPSGAVQTRQEKNRASKQPTQEREGMPWIDDSKQCTLNALCNAVTRRVDVQKAMATNTTIGPFIDTLRKSFLGQNTDLDELSYALVETIKDTDFNGYIRLHQLKQKSTNPISMSELPEMAADSSQKLIVFGVDLDNGLKHTQTIDTKDGYFGDPGYIHGVIKSDFEDDWYSSVRVALNNANKLKDIDAIKYPNTVTHVWCVEYNLPASQRQRKRKREDASGDGDDDNA